MAASNQAFSLFRLLNFAVLGAPEEVSSSLALSIISDIAAADLPTLSAAIKDEKAAKSLLTACKAQTKSGGTKRTAAESLASSSKKSRSAYELANEPQTSAELEASLELPQPSADEEAIVKSVIYTNRAPLVLAFAVELLKYTMDQPLSSRLSLAQAVVSMNSRTKAVSIGLETGKGADEEGWGTGQPKVRVMGREITVLKRTGYEWKQEVKVENEDESGIKNEVSHTQSTLDHEEKADSSSTAEPTPAKKATDGWTVSASVTSKQSTFVASDLRGASHNISAWRVQGEYGVIEDINDDGESGGGRHLLGLLQADNFVGVLLVVSRWYGGIFLGPDRWRIMTQVSRDALSQRLRVAGVIGQEALWGLDLEAMRKKDGPVTGGTAAGMPIHKPQGARQYILKAFSSPPDPESLGKKKKSGAALDREKEENLGLLLGALDMLFGSWVDHLSHEELDRRAWSWYVTVRPEVESGVAGWGGKGQVKLADILNLRRKE
ncbi:related to impact protein [Phialocephala subalpina]|uniref:Related to impact protein n=1 Tax=Phialocephala subalpina TaxID=576137 RepID=A0A1L7X7K6_9HELO|nr:related to impact protein [Phialocephala subalpina]